MTNTQGKQGKPTATTVTQAPHRPGPFPWTAYIDQVFAGLWHNPFRSDTEPCAELIEYEDAYVAEIDLPGVDRKHVRIDVTGQGLTVHATRGARERTGTVRHRTRPETSEFDFATTLPIPIDDNAVTAAMANGVLAIRLPKSAAPKPTRSRSPDSVSRLRLSARGWGTLCPGESGSSADPEEDTSHNYTRNDDDTPGCGAGRPRRRESRRPRA